MNCGMCHSVRQTFSQWPAKTLVFLEGNLGSNDYSGLVGPAAADEAMAFRHNNRGHMVMTDLSILTMTAKDYNVVKKTKQFWFPTDDETGEGGARFNLNLQ
jgi:hypothetical protein